MVVLSICQTRTQIREGGGGGEGAFVAMETIARDRGGGGGGGADEAQTQCGRGIGDRRPGCRSACQ